MKYGRLTILKNEKRGAVQYCLCQCDCGTQKWIRRTALTRTTKPTQSCGCLAKESARIPKYKHGLSYSREYKIWRGVKDRCLNPNNSAYHRYGGLGITIAERWLTFENFISDMGFAPDNTFSVDRIDTRKGYGPSNCRWATNIQQVRNAKSNIYVTYQGQTKCLGEWAEKYNIPYQTLYSRYKTHGLTATDKLFA